MSEISALEIILLGDPSLRAAARPVEDFADAGFRRDAAALHATLREFRRRHGFGRAVSAPQAGIGRRFIAMNLGDGPQLIVNPEITWQSDETLTMWDDCMSFPGLLVRLARHVSISLRFQDERGEFHEWRELDAARSELLQHEIDHLDGVLAIDRMIDRDALVTREVFEQNFDFFRRQVDYVIA